MIKRGTKTLNDYRKDGRLAYSTLINKGKTVINKINSKTKDRNFKYARIRDQYMKDHPLCEFPFCNQPSVECHHKAGRVGENMYKHFMAVCHTHHEYIHQHPKESYENGWMLKQ